MIIEYISSKSCYFIFLSFSFSYSFSFHIYSYRVVTINYHHALYNKLLIFLKKRKKDYILEIYKVDISVLGTLLSSLVLTNIKFLF